MATERDRIENLCRHILEGVAEDTRRKLDTLRDTLLPEAQRVGDEFLDLRERLLRTARREEEALRHRQTTEVCLQIRGRRLQALHGWSTTLIDEAFDAACHTWDQNPTGPHLTTLTLEAVEQLVELGHTKLIVLLPPASLEALPPDTPTSWLTALTCHSNERVTLTIGEAPPTHGPGVTVTTENGDVRYDNSLAARFLRQRSIFIDHVSSEIERELEHSQ